jgi:hypothetical protein
MVPIIRALILILWIPALASAWDFGLNGRESPGYCTDPASTTYFNGDSDPYPTTRGGATFGFNPGEGNSKRDRDNAVDCRLAGNVFATNDGTQASTLEIDLPEAGTYSISIALGDALFSNAQIRAEVYDNSTLLYAIADTDGVAGGAFVDANGVEHTTAANWVSNQTPRVSTFASTKLKVKLGTTTNLGDGSRSTLAHIRITTVVSSGDDVLILGGDL